MKKWFFSLLLFFGLSGFAVSAQSLALYDFSKNQKILIQEIELEGLSRMSREEALEICNLDPESRYFVYELENAIALMISSGFFLDVGYEITPLDKGYRLSLALKENLPLASLKVVDSKMLDLSLLKSKLEDSGVITGKVFSSLRLEEAIDRFNIHNQNYGIFLYEVSFKEISAEEVLQTDGKFLFTPEEAKREGVHILLYITEIPQMRISEIRMLDTTINYDEILNYIQLSVGTLIEKDEDLFFRFKRLNRLGFYESVYFKITPDLKNPGGHQLLIQTRQLETDQITTTLTAPPNIGIVTVLEYYNISLLNSLQRLKLAAGWELSLGSAIFVAEYTHPYFWRGLFFSANLSKNDRIDVIKDSAHQKLTQDYDLKLTSGANIYGNLFGYFFHKENYFIAKTIDQNYEPLPAYEQLDGFQHSSGLIFLFDNLDDNFFVTQGIRVSLDYEVFWKTILAHRFGFSGEIYLPIPVLESVVAMANRTGFLVTDQNDRETTLSLDSRMRTNVQEIASIDEQQIKLTTYGSVEFRFSLAEVHEMAKDISFVVFAEAGGAWADYKDLSLQDTRYGFGIGFRISPRKHYSSFLFQFPAGLYVGYRTGDRSVQTTLVSHRDNLYYVHLTASF